MRERRIREHALLLDVFWPQLGQPLPRHAVLKPRGRPDWHRLAARHLDDRVSLRLEDIPLLE
jgi:hypothetical protein